MYRREYDDDWDDWKVGDKIVWADDKEGEVYYITRFVRMDSLVSRWPCWNDSLSGEECMTRDTNLLRVKIYN